MFQILFLMALSLGAEENQLNQKVTTLFNSKCQKCHNAELAEGDLDLTQLKMTAAQKLELPKRIAPGGGMPKGGAPLSKEEIALVAEWLRTTDVKPPVVKRKLELKDDIDPEDHKQVLELQILRVILNDLTRLSEAEALNARYLTLTHLWVAGESEQKMEVYRQGLTKLLNSLSWKSGLHHPVAIDKHKTILRFSQAALGWKDLHWNLLAATDPYFRKLNEPIYNLLSKFNPEVPVPYVRGDSFAQRVSRSPFYEDILELPKTAKQLAGFFESPFEKNIQEGKVARAGFRKSNVSGFNRLIERHELDTKLYRTVGGGYYWRSYDFDGNSGDKDLFKNPFTAVDKSTKKFNHGGGEVIFSLPNGMQAYWLEKADGTRLDIAPTEIVSDTSRRDTRIFNGISCMGCHVGGLHIKFDSIREHAERTPAAFKADDLALIKKTYKDQTEMAAIFKKDIERYQAALGKIGVKEEGKLDPIRTLVDRFEAPVDLENAAAELGISIEQLKAEAKRNVEVSEALSELENGGLPRDTFIKFFVSFILSGDGKDKFGALKIHKHPEFDPHFEFVEIPAGKFLMGSPKTEKGRDSDPVEKQREVTISEPFEMQTTHVTQSLYEKVNGRNPSLRVARIKPVENVSWLQANQFALDLTLLRNDGYTYRLPTDAEWEYAARAGTQTAYYFGDDPGKDNEILKQHAWFDKKETTSVASLKPNPWGLYDMYGNAFQWVEDMFSEDYLNNRILRGGGFHHSLSDRLRSASKTHFNRDYGDTTTGFRLVRVKKKKAETPATKPAVVTPKLIDPMPYIPPQPSQPVRTSNPVTPLPANATIQERIKWWEQNYPHLVPKK